MKSEERHKLERNALADWIGQTINEIKPYSRTITTAVVLVLLVAVAAVVWPRIRDRGSESTWQTFYSAMSTGNLSELQRIAEERPGTTVAFWAQVVAADTRLANASQQLFSDKASAGSELSKAIEDYAAVIDHSRDPQLRERALFGRARAYETISGTPQGRGELPKAIADYEQVVEKWPNGVYTPLAQEQLKRLKSQDTKVFYDKFAAYTPKRPVSKEGEAAGKQLPFDTSSLPDESPAQFSNMLKLDDLKVKGTAGAEKGTSEKTEPAKGESKTPATKAETPKAEPPKAEPAKTSAAKPETPKAEPPKPAPAAPAPTKAEPPKK